MENVVKTEEEQATQVKQDKQKMLILNADMNESGSISISQNVIAQIIKKNVLNVEGVARFAPKGMADLVNVFSSRAYDSSIIIDFIDGSINISVAVLAFIGTSLPTMGAAIQSALRDQIALITGAKVGKINVIVKDLVDPDDKLEDEKAETEAVEGTTQEAE